MLLIESQILEQITSGQSNVYQDVIKCINELLDEPVTWQLFADDQTSTTKLATITSQEESSCTEKIYNATSGYVQLKATFISDESVFVWLRLRMRRVVKDCL